MHPALRKGPLFAKKHPPIFHFFTKTPPFSTFYREHPPFSTFLNKKLPPFHFVPRGLTVCLPVHANHACQLINKRQPSSSSFSPI